MNEQTIEMQIHAKTQEAIQSINKLTSQLTGIEKKIDSVSNSVNKVSTNNATNEMNKLNSSIDKASKSMTKLKGLFTFTGVKRLTTTILDGLKSSMDYSEALNLFNVVFKNIEKDGKTTFSNLGKEAIEFQNKLNEAFGTNKEQTLTYQALYQSMAENMGIATDKAGIMSENTTKLINDLSSLYNKSEKSVSTALSSGIYAGQVRPLRTYGIDITEKSLQPVLDSLGIERTVRELSQAEKQILRYIAVIRQSSVAHADWAQTIESPSNQLKILSNQAKETKAYLSSLFIGTFANILPYANAFLMVIKEISKAIANMFGIKIQDYNTGIASSEDAFVDLGSSVDDATGKVKELKRQVLGFDEIHNINENQDSGSGSVGGVSGGIDQRLLDAIKGYDNGMDKVRMKASQIRDDIMKWLGFTKEIDPLTGEVSFKYQGIKTTLKNMWDSFKGLSTQGKILVGLGLVTGALKLWNTGKKLVNVFGGGGLVKVTKSLISPMSSLFGWMKTGVQVNGKLTSGLKDGIQAWREQNILVTKTDGSLNKWKTTMNGAKVAVQGLITSAVGLYTVHESMKNLSTEGANLLNVLGLVGGSLTTIASGVQIGSIFGGWGAAIGGTVGAIASLITAINGYETASKKMINNSKENLKEAEQNLKNYYDTKKAIEDSMNGELAFQNYNQRLLDELNSLVEANGKVKTGYEDRVDFILNQLNNAYGTEYTIIDGTIDGYKDLNKTIKDVIETKKAEIILDAEKENYTSAIKNQTEAWKNYNNAIKEYSKNNEKMNDILGKKYEMEYLIGTNAYRNYKYYSELTKQTYKGIYAYQAIQKDLEVYNQTLDINNEKIKTTRVTFQNYTNDIVFYEDLQTAVLSNNVQKQNQLIEDRLNKITTANGEEKMSLSEQLMYYEDISNLRLKILEENGVKITDEMKQQANSQKQSVIDSLVEQTQTVENMTPEIVEAWATLGKQNKDKFLENFKKLPKDVQTEIVDKMQSKGYNISTQLQKGIDGIKPTVKVNADTSNANYVLNQFLDNLKKNFGTSTITGSILGSSLRFNENGGVYSNGSWKNIPQYANGGMPSHGSMFIAGEHGAEIVGHINGKTEVLNQSQIASAIYNAVASAMNQFSGGGIAEIKVRADEGIIVETAINGINQKTRQTGVCPVDIPIY